MCKDTPRDKLLKTKDKKILKAARETIPLLR